MMASEAEANREIEAARRRLAAARARASSELLTSSLAEASGPARAASSSKAAEEEVTEEWEFLGGAEEEGGWEVVDVVDAGGESAVRVEETEGVWSVHPVPRPCYGKGHKPSQARNMEGESGRTRCLSRSVPGVK